MINKVSIVVPVYNVEKSIRRCIKSILNQEYKNFELLLIDDGSTDSSAAICDEYACIDNRIVVFRQLNGGVSCARNKGIDNSNGDFILFVDSDDYLEPNCLSTLLGNNPADITYMSSNVHYDTGDVTSFHLHAAFHSTSECIENEILHLKVNPQGYVYFGYTWNKLFRSNIIKEHNIRFVEHLSFYEDDAFTLECFRYAKTLKTLPDCLYNYVVSSTGLTAAINSCEEYEMLIDANFKNMCFIKSEKLLKYEINRLFSLLLEAIRQAQKQHRKKMFEHLVKKAHDIYITYIIKYDIPIRKAYRKKKYWLFRINILIHKR